MEYYNNFDEISKETLLFVKKHALLNFEILSSYKSLKEDSLKYGENLESFIVKKGNEPQVTTFRAIPFNILISHSENENAVKILAKYLGDENIKYPGIYGPLDSIIPFAQGWRNRTKKFFLTKDEMWLFFLKKLKFPLKDIGTVITATEKNIPMVHQWSDEAVKQLMPNVPETFLKSCRQNLSYRIKEQKVFLMKRNNEIVSMAAISGETENLQTINNVFTPPEYRGKGYATNLCSYIAKKIREKGNYPILTVKVDNTNAIHIYKKIGFKERGKMGLYLF